MRKLHLYSFIVCGLLLAVVSRVSAQVLVVYSVPSQSYANDVQAKLIGTGLISGGVTLYNESSGGPPSLSTLQGYKSVLVFSDSTFNNASGLGDVLANYVDAGGGVVQAAFTTFTSWSLAGRWETGHYDPASSLGSYGPGAVTLGTIHQPSSPILNGVTSLNSGGDYFGTPLTLVSGAVDVADWSNGTPLVVVNSNFGNRVVLLNLYPPSSDALGGSWLSNTQGALLMANALNFVAVPEPSVTALLGLGAGVTALAGWFRRRR